MNATYVKREIGLNTLGLDMATNVKELMNYFNLSIDKDNLVKESGALWDVKGYIYSSGNVVLLFYDVKNREIWVNYDNIWSKLKSEYGLTYHEVKELQTILLEEALEVRIATTDSVFQSNQT